MKGQRGKKCTPKLTILNQNYAARQRNYSNNTQRNRHLPNHLWLGCGLLWPGEGPNRLCRALGVGRTHPLLPAWTPGAAHNGAPLPHLALLAVGEVGDDTNDVPGTGGSQRICHDQQLHHGRVHVSETGEICPLGLLMSFITLARISIPATWTWVAKMVLM